MLFDYLRNVFGSASWVPLVVVSIIGGIIWRWSRRRYVKKATKAIDDAELVGKYAGFSPAPPPPPVKKD